MAKAFRQRPAKPSLPIHDYIACIWMVVRICFTQLFADEASTPESFVLTPFLDCRPRTLWHDLDVAQRVL